MQGFRRIWEAVRDGGDTGRGDRRAVEDAMRDPRKKTENQNSRVSIIKGTPPSGWEMWRATKRQTNQSLPRVALFGDVPTTVTTCRTMVSGNSHVETILRSSAVVPPAWPGPARLPHHKTATLALPPSLSKLSAQHNVAALQHRLTCP